MRWFRRAPDDHEPGSDKSGRATPRDEDEQDDDEQDLDEPGSSLEEMELNPELLAAEAAVNRLPSVSGRPGPGSVLIGSTPRIIEVPIENVQIDERTSPTASSPDVPPIDQ